MAFYDKEAPNEAVTDASPVGLGAILVQEKREPKTAVVFAAVTPVATIPPVETTTRPTMISTHNGSNLVSHEMEEFFNNLGIKQGKTISLWPRVNGDVERQNKSLLKTMCLVQAEGKPWQQELQKYLFAYMSTPHTRTGVSPAELLYGRKI